MPMHDFQTVIGAENVPDDPDTGETACADFTCGRREIRGTGYNLTRRSGAMILISN
jgi:hypothetical protein